MLIIIELYKGFDIISLYSNFLLGILGLEMLSNFKWVATQLSSWVNGSLSIVLGLLTEASVFYLLAFEAMHHKCRL